MVRQVADGRLSAPNVIQGNERRIKRLMELFAFALTTFAAATLGILSSSEQSCSQTSLRGAEGRQLGRAKRRLGLGSAVKPQCMEDDDQRFRLQAKLLITIPFFGASRIVIPGVSLYSGFACQNYVMRLYICVRGVEFERSALPKKDSIVVSLVF